MSKEGDHFGVLSNSIYTNQVTTTESKESNKSNCSKNKVTFEKVKDEIITLIELYIHYKYDISETSCNELANFIFDRTPSSVYKHYLPCLTDFDDPFIIEIINNVVSNDYVISRYLITKIKIQNYQIDNF